MGGKDLPADFSFAWFCVVPEGGGRAAEGGREDSLVLSEGPGALQTPHRALMAAHSQPREGEVARQDRLAGGAHSPLSSPDRP